MGNNQYELYEVRAIESFKAVISIQQDEIFKLKAENEKLRKDAERYAFMRDEKHHRWSIQLWKGYWDPLYGTELDEAIDAAMTPDTKGE